MDTWKRLLRRALVRLEAVGVDRTEWVWGGGTMLMLRYGHRHSRDIDLFLNDVQLLTYLSPRLTELADDRPTGYSEAANHLRLVYPEGEVDFLAVAPVFPELRPHVISLDGFDGKFEAMADEEILGQKIHYRAAGFTGRDLYDFVVVSRDNQMVLSSCRLHAVALARRDALEISLHDPTCREGYERLDRPSRNLDFVEARAWMLGWIADGPQRAGNSTR